MSKIKVLLVDDHTILRQGLRALLEACSDMTVVGEASDGQEAIAKVRELRPDVVVMDVAMPGMNGLTATRHILAEHPGIRVLILTQYDNREYVLPLIQAGVAGYVLKQAADTDLMMAIRAVYRGESFLYPPIARMLLDSYVSDHKSADPYDSLTPREREVLIFIAQGYTNRQIAEILHISPKTVDVHRTRLMQKLDLHNVADITRYAIRRGLLDPG